jgi:hypothetical protein
MTLAVLLNFAWEPAVYLGIASVCLATYGWWWVLGHKR